MTTSHSYWASSIGKKILMAVTGLVLFLFVVGHLLGNLQLFLGQDVFNNYASFLQNLGPALWGIRGFLMLMLVVHVLVSFLLTRENSIARPERYQKKVNVKATESSNYMGILGSLILIFVIVHLLHFTAGIINPEHYSLVDDKGRHDVYTMVALGFKNGWMASFYIIMMAFLGLHLRHGIPSFFQTLGVTHPVLKPIIEKSAPWIALVIALGYIIIPVAIFFGIITLPTGGGVA